MANAPTLDRPRTKVPSKARGVKRRSGNFGTYLFACSVICILAWGWWRRNDGLLNAEHGLGYALGICGAAMMLALLSYPLRKRARFMRGWGPVSFWFRLHMFLGIAGPVLILFHANFAAGSKNSSVALIAMLIVVASGLVGRFFHGKLHAGLYGARAGTRSLVDDAKRIRQRLKENGGLTPNLEQRMRSLEDSAVAPRVAFAAAVRAVLSMSASARRVRKGVRRRIDQSGRRLAREQGWPPAKRRSFVRAANRMATTYFGKVEKAAKFPLYERLFALWHLLHVPLFLILILTVLLHVVAVHMY